MGGATRFEGRGGGEGGEEGGRGRGRGSEEGAVGFKEVRATQR